MRPGAARDDQGDLSGRDLPRLDYRYAEAEGESRATAQDREWVRFFQRLAAHVPGIEPAIICVAETMSELEMGHFTRVKFGTPADPHLAGVLE